LERSSQLHVWPPYPKRNGPGTHYIGGWVNLGTDLDDLKKRKVLPQSGLYTDRSQSLYQLRNPSTPLRTQGSQKNLVDGLAARRIGVSGIKNAISSVAESKPVMVAEWSSLALTL
jgi:hypothetical protein